MSPELLDAYSEFVAAKCDFTTAYGFDVDDSEIHPLLLPHQRDIVRWAVHGGRRAIFAAFGLGKAQPIDEPVLTPKGWSPIGELAVGDEVITADGNPTKIRAVYPQGQRSIMKVTLNDGSTVRCDRDHLWTVATDADASQGNPWRVMSTSELLEAGLMDQFKSTSRLRWRIPVVSPVQHAQSDLPIDPYVMGVLLGDGSFREQSVLFTCGDSEIVAEVKQRLPDGMRIATVKDSSSRTPSFRLVVEGRTNWNKRNPFRSAIIKWGLQGHMAHEKFVPSEYLYSSVEQRLDLLRGLMDTDGYAAADGTIQFSSSSPLLASDVAEIVRSLGGTARTSSKIPTYPYQGEKRRGREHFTVTIRVPNGTLPFLLPRKVARCRNRYYQPLRKIAAIEPAGIAEAVCISVEHPSQLYVTRDHIVTHNTLSQLETVRLTLQHTGGRGLIVMPLGVRQEFKRDATDKLGIPVRFIRRDNELDGDGGIWLTNYESIRDGGLDPSLFQVVSLDEASVLRSYGSKTFWSFLELCEGVPHKFVATATPSPNRFKELIHYAGFLGVMQTGEALTRFFQRDSTKANQLTLYPHKEREFWLWVASWAVFVQAPSDLGYSDEGYELPELDVRYHEVPVDHAAHTHFEGDGQGRLYRGADMSAIVASRERRLTMDARMAKVVELVNEAPDDEHFILWHDLEDERRAIKKALPEAVEVYGSLDLDEREQRIIDFSDGKHRILATKPILSGSGCNFQRHCHRAIFAGVGFKFNDFIQAIHRIHRFQQPERCRIDIVYAESERDTLRTLQRKWTQHKELTHTMSEVIKEHGLNQTEIHEVLKRSIGCERIEASGEGWTAVNNDTIQETAGMETDSVDLIVTSIPFSNHYEYTPSYLDLGHTDNNGHFWEQMDFLTPNLLRVLKPGRVYACHTKDRVLFGNVTGAGAPTISPFHAECIMHGMKHGFDYMGMITVVTDVVRENNQTYRLGWTEQTKDGTKMGVGSPEYILLFRKPQTDRSRGYADVPVVKSKADYTKARWQVDAHAFWRSSGDRHLTPEELGQLPPDQLYGLFTAETLTHIYDYQAHIKIGEILDAKGSLPSTFMLLAPGSHHPDVWHDINRMLTLNGAQARRNVQLHICPIQTDICERLIERYSMKGELVYDPFGGLSTVAVQALKMGRRGYTVELNPGYWADGCHYLAAEEARLAMPTLFNLEEVGQV